MLFTAFITILGLSLFEAVSSVDNAIINAEVLQTMGARARKWFLTWGMFIAVFLVRGALPFLIIWAFNTSLTPIQVLSAAWSNDPLVLESIEKSAPILLVAGGVFLLFLFLHWLFLEIIDTTFSIDGVLGAFAFTLSVPLILLGNGLGALLVRDLTIRNIEHIKKYIYLKNGAMYSILVLGIVMILH